MADKPSGFPWLTVNFQNQAPKSDGISIRDWLLNAVLPLLMLFAAMSLLSWLLTALV